MSDYDINDDPREGPFYVPLPGLEIRIANPSEKPIKLEFISGKTRLGNIRLKLPGRVIKAETSEVFYFRGDTVARQLRDLGFPGHRPVSIILNAEDELGNSFDLREISIKPDSLQR